MRSNLVAFRKELGLTQEEMADMFSRSKQYWCNLEKGREKGNADLWLDIGVKFNLTAKQVQKLREIA